MKHIVTTNWIHDMQFESNIDEHKIVIDALTEQGGQNNGPSPKKLLLSALAGCTGMDVISILKKMRSEPEQFEIIVESDMTDEHPKHYKSFHIIYRFTGKNLDMDKIKKAIELSQERYCGVSHMFKSFATLTTEIQIVENI